MPARPFSLTAQIAEVDYELGQRARVYRRLVAARKMKQSEADYHIGCMQAVLRTLVWLRDHEAKIEAALAAVGDGA